MSLGLVHGHYDVLIADVDNDASNNSLSVDKINTGIAVVVPVEKIIETLDFHSKKNV